jgi:hypothetical protein
VASACDLLPALDALLPNDRDRSFLADCLCRGIRRGGTVVRPFYWMQGAVALAALYMTVFILATQRREDELADRHEQLTLELAMLSEQKAAKLSRCWKSCARTILRSKIGLTRRRPQCRPQQTPDQY